MGEVYRARDATLRREVAIKVLAQDWSRDPERLRRFELEAQAAATLNHPGIVSIFHFGQHDGSPYIVTELLKGETLRDRLRREPMRVREVLEVGTSLAQALAAAHGAGVVHRDLKPENIFLTDDGRVKILDFGLARFEPPATPGVETVTTPLNTTPGLVMGTVGYMSPEQVRGQPADARSDIFALGLILYEVLTGQRAFRKPTGAESMTAVLNEEPAPISQLCPGAPPGLQRVINRCLMKKPEQRFQHASDLAFALEALWDSASSPVIAGAPAIRSRWRWVPFAIASVAVLAAAAIWSSVPPAIPVVESVKQLTDDGEEKLESEVRLATDGSRVYFTEGPTGSVRLAQVSVNGGRTGIIDDGHVSSTLWAISPDGSSLLTSLDRSDDVRVRAPMWSVPIPAGEPRRLGELKVNQATYFPDGRLVLVNGPDVLIADGDGSNARRLATLYRAAWFPAVSPDGKTIVVSTEPFAKGVLTEVAADGSAPPRRLGEGMTLATWSADGKYLIYGSPHLEGSDLWALPMQTGWLHRGKKPVRLTNGALLFVAACSSRDGKQIFAVGNKMRSELLRFDAKTGQFLPFLPGLSALSPTFSADGKWMEYTSYPDHTLWRARGDGTDRMQLTLPPLEVAFPNISYDGSKVAFANGTSGEIYVVSVQGGSPEKVVARDCDTGVWSPDGNQLILGCRTTTATAGILRLYNVRTRKLSDVPAGEGMVGGEWVTDHVIVACNQDHRDFRLFDLKTEKWTHLLTGDFVNWAVTRDGRYLVYSTGGADPRLERLRFADRQVEILADLKGVRRVVDPVEGQTQLTLVPDGLPILARDIGSQEIYALTVRWP
jgi:serine/threonine protein kinase